MSSVVSKASRKVVVVGAVAGGASCAARVRRLDEHAQITILEKGNDPSFANCAARRARARARAPACRTAHICVARG